MEKESYLYGLERSNHDFTEEKSFGKNIFTCAFPVSLAIYISQEKELEQNYINVSTAEDGEVCVKHDLMPLDNLIGAPLEQATWSFEKNYSAYDALSTGTAKRSDLVVEDASTGKDVRALELKLVAAPTSGTAKRAREEQSCEIVVRPPTIEQMCFSIASSYGKSRRHDIGDILAKELKNPMDFSWSDESYMLEKLPLVLSAAEAITKEGIAFQTPFVLNALWRTKGKSTVFDDECFDVFFWSDLAFLQLFINATRKAIEKGENSIGRPARSLVWLVKSLLDYSMQGAVTFDKAHRDITYGGQTDKAGAFSGNSVLPFMGCRNFYHPRIHYEEYMNIIMPEGIAFLSPERRLDGFIKSDFDRRGQSAYDYGAGAL